VHQIDTSVKHVRSTRVYALQPVSSLVKNERRLAAALFGMRSLDDQGRIFRISPISGYLFYCDQEKLWKNTAGRGLPTDRLDVERTGRGFLENANLSVSCDRVLRREGIAALFPTDVRLLWVGAIVPQKRSRPDHWLCQFGVDLPVDRERRARVDGAKIDLRIGADRTMLAVSSRWRSLQGDFLDTETIGIESEDALYSDAPLAVHRPRPAATQQIEKPFPALAAEASRPGDLSHGDDPTEYLYSLADENAPQTHLAPFLFRGHQHHAEQIPASTYSLCADILQRGSNHKLELLAVVRGGSGRYEYRWYYWEPHTVVEAGMAALGTGPQVNLSPGIYNVVLLVRDLATNSVIQAERSVHAEA